MYHTRRSSSRVRRSSRVDRRKTRVGFLGYLKDSDDSASDTADSASDPADSASDTADSPSGNVVHSNTDDAEDRRDEEQPVVSGSDEEEACAAPRAGRKRSSTAVLADSPSSSDSDEVGRPVRKVKVLAKKRLNMQPPLSDSDAEEEGDAARPEREKEKRRERRAKLLQLSQRRRARAGRSVRGTTEEGSGKDDNDDDDEDATCTLLPSSEEGSESDSLKDFIVDDEEQNGGDEGQSQERSILSYHLPHMALGSQQDHFELVVKALLINAGDQTFLQSLYAGVRTKRYACEMKDSLDHLDLRTVNPRLVNLKQRSRWSERYKERVECYPDVKILHIGRSDQTCEACQLHRHTRFCVRLSGQLYDNKTLLEDPFMPNDTQDFRVGVVCAGRTEVYHQLKHFKFHLFRQCKAELEKEKEAPVKDMVGEAFSRLRACGWIRQQYEDFEEHLNRADYFQEEKLD